MNPKLRFASFYCLYLRSWVKRLVLSLVVMAFLFAVAETQGQGLNIVQNE